MKPYRFRRFKVNRISYAASYIYYTNTTMQMTRLQTQCMPGKVTNNFKATFELYSHRQAQLLYWDFRQNLKKSKWKHTTNLTVLRIVYMARLTIQSMKHVPHVVCRVKTAPGPKIWLYNEYYIFESITATMTNRLTDWLQFKQYIMSSTVMNLTGTHHKKVITDHRHSWLRLSEV